MRHHKTNLLPLAILISLASCNTVHRNPAEREALDPMELRWAVSAFHENSEVDEIELNDPTFINEKRRDVDRKRSGAQLAVGIEYVQGYVELYSSDSLGTGADEGGGIGVGATAEINLHEFDNDLSVFFPYKLGLNVTGGDGTFAGVEADYGTLEAISDIGIGIDYKGFRPSIGFTSKAIRGVIEFENENDEDDEEDLDDIDGEYAAGYAELAYRSPEIPGQIAVRALAGDEDGVYFKLSFLF